MQFLRDDVKSRYFPGVDHVYINFLVSFLLRYLMIDAHN